MGLLIVIAWFGSAAGAEVLAFNLGASQTTSIAIGLATFVLVPALLYWLDKRERARKKR